MDHNLKKSFARTDLATPFLIWQDYSSWHFSEKISESIYGTVESTMYPVSIKLWIILSLIRKVDRYGIYDRFKFRVPLGEHGDVFDRYMIRILEMRESVGILEQALATISEGPIIDPKAKLRGFRPKVGEAYGRIEAPKGELGFYLISDGSGNPYRYRVRPPSFINLTILEDLCLGHTVADVMVILGSVDIVMGEVDR